MPGFPRLQSHTGPGERRSVTKRFLECFREHQIYGPGARTSPAVGEVGILKARIFVGERGLPPEQFDICGVLSSGELRTKVTASTKGFVERPC
jgi:hypothetical protein